MQFLHENRDFMRVKNIEQMYNIIINSPRSFSNFLNGYILKNIHFLFKIIEVIKSYILHLPIFLVFFQILKISCTFLDIFKQPYFRKYFLFLTDHNYMP